MPDATQSGHHRIANTFNFRVTLRKSSGGANAGPQLPEPAGSNAGGADFLGDGGFQECSGLEIEMDAQELQEGGFNDGVVRLVGRGKYTNLVFKRGMFFAERGGVSAEFWNWLQSVISSTRPVVRYDGMIEVLDNSANRPLATWTFSRGLPVRIRGPELNARTGEIAIEELHIAHEGLRLELTP